MRSPLTQITLGFGICLIAVGTGVSPAAPAKAPKKAGGAAQIAHGKALISSLRCNGCHGANLAGKQGFSPSLHAGGVLREYNAQKWARVMDTGVTNDGGHVQKPMPVYHLKPADSGALYAYLKTLK